jgi:hypothetical protein
MTGRGNVLPPMSRQEAELMTVYRVVYTSQPFGFDSAVLGSILIDARRLNARDDVTGALICRHDIYLQLLEGPEEKVRETIRRITRDDRHLDVRVHVSETAAARLFPDWAMLHDPAASWIWTQEQVLAGAVDSATADEVMRFFLQLRDLHDRADGL